MWRRGFDTPHNYDDNQLFCGGFSVQWNKYGGKCGLCGDPWPGPRDNEPGGKYATGMISKKYSAGQVIQVTVQLTANHKGWFEFRLCEHNNPFTNITQECLDKHLLVLDDTGETRYKVIGPDVIDYSVKENIKINLRLPQGLTCAACVLQWKYNAGNSWGKDPDTGAEGIGFGPQEQFYGCADVAIGREDVKVGVVPEKFPWYVPESESEWRYGIAYVFGDTASISAAACLKCSELLPVVGAAVLASLAGESLKEIKTETKGWGATAAHRWGPTVATLAKERKFG
nr:hypothetical protein BaRGS_000437 [Batillaria attramentaria]